MSASESRRAALVGVSVNQTDRKKALTRFSIINATDQIRSKSTTSSSVADLVCRQVAARPE